MENLPLVKAKWSQHRDRLKPIIDKIGLKASEPELYTNIDKACSNEQAFLFLVHDGFFILRPRYQRQITYMDLVVGYSEGVNAMVKYLPVLISLAKQGEAQFLRFYSVRKGFDKVALRYGWFKRGYHRQYTIWQYKL